MNEPDEAHAGQSVPPVAAGTKVVAARPLTAASFARAFGERCPNCKSEVDRNGERAVGGAAGEAGRDVMQIVCPECRAGLGLDIISQEPPVPVPGTEDGEASRAAALAAFLSTRERPCPRCRYNLRGLRNVRCPECESPLRLVLRLRPPDSWLNTAAWVVALVSVLLPLGLQLLVFGGMLYDSNAILLVRLTVLLLLAVLALVLAGWHTFRRLPPVAAMVLAASCFLLIPTYLFVQFIAFLVDLDSSSQW
jgi:hypothetical protein